MVIEKILGRHQEKNKSQLSVIRGSLGVFLLKILGVGLVFLMQAILARILGTRGYGEYAYIINWVLILGLISTLGFDTSSIRYIATYLGANDKSAAKRFENKSQLITVLGSVAICAPFYIIMKTIGVSAETSGRNAVLWGTVLIPIHGVLLLKIGAAQGWKLPIIANIPRSIIRPAIIIFLCTLFSLWIGVLSIDHVILFELSATVFSIVFISLAISRKKKSRLDLEESSIYGNDGTSVWLATSIPIMIVSSIRLTNRRLSVIILGSTSNASEVGIFAIADQVVGLVAFGLLAINAVIAPIAAELYSKNKIGSLQELLTYSVRLVCFVAIGMGAIFVVGGKTILLVFGIEYQEAYYPLIILIAGQIVNSLSGSVGYLLLMTGQQNVLVKYSIIALFANAGLNIFLIQKFGVIGAAIATSTTTALWNIVLVRVVIKKLKVNPTLFRISQGK